MPADGWDRGGGDRPRRTGQRGGDRTDGRVVLRIEDGLGSVERGGEGRLSLHVRELASLYTGFHRAEHLRTLGRITGDDESVAAADRAFAGPVPWMPDTF